MLEQALFSSSSGFRFPTLIIHAQDDPFIPFDSFRHPDIQSNSNVVLLAPEQGGHVGFISADREGEDRFWPKGSL
jgi:predicted alpha/beta-fold hydrolase